MNRPAALIAAFLILCPQLMPAQKRAAPRKAPSQAIRFQGAPQYTQDELMAASGIKPGVRLTAAEVKARAKQLNDTGMFSEVKFGADSKGLIFTLTPASRLYPMHLDNLPLQPGKELDAELHGRQTLFRGQLPASGSIVDGVSRALEEMLAAEGVKATVKAALTSGVGPQKITAMNLSIAAPPVRIGAIQVSGDSPAMQAKVSALVASQAGNEFDTENSAAGLQHAFENMYQDEGYAAAKVDVSELSPPVVSDQAIEIPFAVKIQEGGIYKLGAINYPADALVPRAEVEKAVKKTGSGAGRPLDLFLLAVRDAYHTRGYLDCSVESHASFNEATHIVNYSVEIDPGQAYAMGTVQFDGAPDAMAAKLKAAWKLALGAAFDESYVSSFAASAQRKDKTLAKWMQNEISTFDVKPDPAARQVNVVFHFAKAAQGDKNTP